MASPVQAGEVIADRYRVERILGEGGMGVVVAAHHLMLGERVAMKFLLPAALQHPEVVARFQREARAAAKISSENVARVMDVGALSSGEPYLVMEYLEGRDLKAELEARGTLPIREAVTYVLQACAGLAEAHAVGIVHRDVKPSNLFLARLPSGRSIVKLLDFGIAKQVSTSGATELTHTFSVLGSAPYMSPEQVRAAKNVDVRTDVWSLGAVLFQLLTGQLPFEGDTVTAIAAAIIADPPTSLRGLRPEVPAELEAIVLGCLEKKADKRTESLAVLAAKLAPFAGSGGDLYAARAAQALDVVIPSRPPLGSVPGVSPESASVQYAVVAGASGAPVATLAAATSEPHAHVAAQTIPTADVRDATRSNWVDTANRSIRKQVQRRPIAVAGGAAIGLVVIVGLWKALSGSGTPDTQRAAAPSAQAELPVTAQGKPTPAEAAPSDAPTRAASATAPVVVPYGELPKEPDEARSSGESTKASRGPSTRTDPSKPKSTKPVAPAAKTPPPPPAKTPRTTADKLIKSDL